MTQSATTTTVRRQILVNAPIGEAFKVFTERFGDFKPREHHLLRAPIAETVFEPRRTSGDTATVQTSWSVVSTLCQRSRRYFRDAAMSHWCRYSLAPVKSVPPQRNPT